jgi:hypothetical protein
VRLARPAGRGRPALHQQAWIDSGNNHAVAALAVSSGELAHDAADKCLGISE